jgi:Protein of unknown function (DUF3326)
MRVSEREFEIPLVSEHVNLREHFAREVQRQVADDEVPVRFAVTSTDASGYRCEIGILSGQDKPASVSEDSIFALRPRLAENPDKFNVVMLVPTGVGAHIGGHAGDAGPAAILLSSVCDHLITHPNVVNASDINELPANGLYVEGSVICRLLQGTAGLQRVRSNRVLCVLDDHDVSMLSDVSINSLNAARATYGLDASQIVLLKPTVELKAEYSSSGRAVGTVDGLEHLVSGLAPFGGTFDAIALASIIKVPRSYHLDYFNSGGDMVNPWGGVEAIFTHAVSMLFNLPSAHSPMCEDEEILELDTGLVDPRMAAEAVSMAFLQCILKGLQRSPRIVTGEAMRTPGVLTAADVSCLVVPEGCLGLPVLAALEQGIPVIAVRENSNLMRNDLAVLPWAPGQYRVVENYWEAAGVLCAMKAGIAPDSVRRPIARAAIHRTFIEPLEPELLASDEEPDHGAARSPAV